MVRVGYVLLALGVAAALHGLVGPAAAGLFEQHHHFHAASGQPIMVGQHAVTDKHCQSAGMPLITVDSGPSHGTISTAPGSHVVKEAVGRSQCEGREVQDMQIFYTSAAGYHGKDRFHLTIRLGSSTIEDDVSVKVE